MSEKKKMGKIYCRHVKKVRELFLLKIAQKNSRTPLDLFDSLNVEDVEDVGRPALNLILVTR